MEILGELAWCIDNAELLAELPNEVYERILFCTLVPDIEVSFLYKFGILYFNYRLIAAPQVVAALG